MAEVYTVVVNNETPTEITGGRVGSFRLFAENYHQALFIGGSAMAAQYVSAPHVTDGLRTIGTATIELYVTSPDEIFAVVDTDQEDFTDTLTIFHNR
jgi:hypothetical protein